MDVYIVTTANGKPPSASLDSETWFLGVQFSSVQFEHPQVDQALEGLSQCIAKAARPGRKSAVSLRQVRWTISAARWKRHWTARWSIETTSGGCVRIQPEGRQEALRTIFSERLRDQFNLSHHPAQRRVQVVVLKPR